MDHILSLSYGKDSLACLGAIEELGWPLDRIVTADLWATDTIPADLPPMEEFKKRADVAIRDRWGIEVEHIRGLHTAEERIYRKRIKGNRIGQMVGWPRIKGCEIQSSCKREPLQKALKNNILYWGIAANEPARIERHRKKANVKMPLVAIGWTEEYCRVWCEKTAFCPQFIPIWSEGDAGFAPIRALNSSGSYGRNTRNIGP